MKRVDISQYDWTRRKVLSGTTVKSVEISNGREIDCGLPCVNGRDGLGRIGFPEDHPGAALLDQALGEIS